MEWQVRRKRTRDLVTLSALWRYLRMVSMASEFCSQNPPPSLTSRRGLLFNIPIILYNIGQRQLHDRRIKNLSNPPQNINKSHHIRIFKVTTTTRYTSVSHCRYVLVMRASPFCAELSSSRQVRLTFFTPQNTSSSTQYSIIARQQLFDSRHLFTVISTR
jgi:hypothetical protein